MIDGEEALIAAGGMPNQPHSQTNQQIDDDECGDGGQDDGEESELERYLRDIS